MTPFCRVRWTERQYRNGEYVGDRAHGVLMSEAIYVPGHPPSSHALAGVGRWICIVATASGNREMNPLDLTVTGVWVPGEPIEEAA